MVPEPKNLFLLGPASTRWRLPKEMTAAATEFTAPVGDAVSAWNYCHSAFGRLFAVIVAPQNFHMALAMWRTLQNDNSPRELLMSAANVYEKNQPMLR